jgi:HSF-type DNA-binding
MKLPTSPSRNALKSCDEQNFLTTDHVNESAVRAFFGGQRIVNDIDILDLGYGRRSMICLPQTLATSKVMYNFNSSFSLGITDLMRISNQSRLRLAWQRRSNIILQHSHAHYAGLCTPPFLRRQASPIDIELPLPEVLSISKVMEKYRLLNAFSNMQHSTVLSTAQQLDREIHNPKDCMLSGFFPVKLHRLLLDLHQSQGGANIAHFVPNGKAFVILDSHHFETEVMKEYFPRMSSFASFQRQLNLYDFRPTRYGPSSKAYYHPSFMREFPSMCFGMRRIKDSRNIGNKKV